jgi:predicted PurR-regulated permease PerM
MTPHVSRDHHPPALPPEEPAPDPGPEAIPAGDSVRAPAVDPTAQATPVEPGAPTPDLTKLATALERETARSIGITILVVLALLYTLYFARAFVIPIAFAVLLNLLLSPAIRALARLRIPPPLGAGFVILALLGGLGAGGYALAGPARAWVAKAPRTLAAARAKLERVREPVEQVTRTAEQVESAANLGPSSRVREVVVRGPSLASRLFGTTESLLVGALEVLVLLYFLLAGGDLFLQKLIKVLPQFRDKRTAVRIARETEASISTYLLTVTMVNAGEGLVVAAAMHLLHLPNALLWGTLAALLEFIPYLGAATMVGVLTLAGFTTFSSTGHALLVPLSFLAINLIQANFVTPLLLGHRLTLNPVAIFVGLALWFFLWGIPGAFIAVPLLATFKILCDHIEPLAPIGEFLGERTGEERRHLVRG